MYAGMGWSKGRFPVPFFKVTFFAIPRHEYYLCNFIEQFCPFPSPGGSKAIRMQDVFENLFMEHMLTELSVVTERFSNKLPVK